MRTVRPNDFKVSIQIGRRFRETPKNIGCRPACRCAAGGSRNAVRHARRCASRHAAARTGNGGNAGETAGWRDAPGRRGSRSGCVRIDESKHLHVHVATRFEALAKRDERAAANRAADVSTIDESEYLRVHVTTRFEALAKRDEGAAANRAACVSAIDESEYLRIHVAMRFVALAKRNVR
ncbi:hypothetical protein [Burkholderia sp. LMG 32019]|uniref:hypothetical protein n=1 Tax=Burkholderia sp. LMG 32019 TaxID=3158173 RepID=UPI003C2D3928